MILGVYGVSHWPNVTEQICKIKNNFININIKLGLILKLINHLALFGIPLEFTRGGYVKAIKMYVPHEALNVS